MIDESLDPEENPAKEGRYRFTLAHEGGGHWRLHRHLFAKDPAQVTLFEDPPTVFHLPVERSQEARGMAGGFLLLLPADAAQAGLRRLGRDVSRIASRASFSLGQHSVTIRSSKSGGSTVESAIDCSETDDEALDRIARPLLKRFSSRRSRCASDWRSLGCCIAKFRANAFSVAFRSVSQGEPRSVN